MKIIYEEFVLTRNQQMSQHHSQICYLECEENGFMCNFLQLYLKEIYGFLTLELSLNILTLEMILNMDS